MISLLENPLIYSCDLILFNEILDKLMLHSLKKAQERSNDINYSSFIALRTCVRHTSGKAVTLSDESVLLVKVSF